MVMFGGSKPTGGDTENTIGAVAERALLTSACTLWNAVVAPAPKLPNLVNAQDGCPERVLHC